MELAAALTGMVLKTPGWTLCAFMTGMTALTNKSPIASVLSVEGASEVLFFIGLISCRGYGFSDNGVSLNGICR